MSYYTRRWALNNDKVRGIQFIDQSDRVNIIFKKFWLELGYYFPQHMLISILQVQRRKKIRKRGLANTMQSNCPYKRSIFALYINFMTINTVADLDTVNIRPFKFKLILFLTGVVAPSLGVPVVTLVLFVKYSLV